MFKVEPSTEIGNRKEFAFLCNARKLWRAVEVGTDRGEFAKQFLDNWNGEALYCIDPYDPYVEMTWDREADRSMALQLLAPHVSRLRFVRQYSPAAIAAIPDWFMVEFVYVDGAHDYKSVKADIEAWWSRLYPHGATVLAGHDFDEIHPGVVRAVIEFAIEKNVIVRHTYEGESPRSWYIYRNEPEILCAFRVEPPPRENELWWKQIYE